nr:hypothetical protein [Tanacetum cinerariifolium]
MEGEGMLILKWMLMEEMKQTTHYQMIELGSQKESSEVKNSADVLIFHDDDEEEDLARDALIKRKRDKGKGMEEIMDTPLTTPIRSPRTHISPISLNKETL